MDPDPAQDLAPDPTTFVIDLQDANKKTLKVLSDHFSKIKSHKEVTKQ
jgi:hypothetical protein